jgi:hypothetical protein
MNVIHVNPEVNMGMNVSIILIMDDFFFIHPMSLVEISQNVTNKICIHPYVLTQKIID